MDIMNVYNSITDIDLQFTDIQNPRSCMDIHDSITDIQNGMLEKWLISITELWGWIYD